MLWWAVLACVTLAVGYSLGHQRRETKRAHCPPIDRILINGTAFTGVWWVDYEPGSSVAVVRILTK